MHFEQLEFLKKYKKELEEMCNEAKANGEDSAGFEDLIKTVDKAIAEIEGGCNRLKKLATLAKWTLAITAIVAAGTILYQKLSD